MAMLYALSLIAVLLISSPVATAQQTTADPHGYDGKGNAAAQAETAPPSQTMGEMDQRMKRMQSLHDRMMSASTPEERQQAMDELRREMQEGMSMMAPMMQGRGMGGGMMGQNGKLPIATPGFRLWRSAWT